MKKSTFKAAAALVFVLPAASLLAQSSGTSHPDEVPITTSPEGIAQPVVYTPTPQATLKVRTTPSETRVLTEQQPGAPAAVEVRTTSTVVVSEADTSEQAAALESERVRPFLTAPASDAGIVTSAGEPANQLPVGTLLKVRLSRELSTRVALGTPFTAELAESAERNGHVIFPAGSILTGKVSEVHGGRRVTGNASIHLRPDTITLPDGTIYPLHAQVVDTDLFHSTKVDQEGTIERKDHALKTVGAFAVSAGSGAAAGALLGGWPGALIGAGVGAGVSTVVWLKQDRQADMPAGTRMVLSLTKPVDLGRN